MTSFEVIGGNKLKGEIIPQGAKNEALQIISAVLLTDEKITISNIPDIIDVNNLIELLQDMNVKIDRTDRHTCTFQADDVNLNYLRSEEFKNKSGRLRGSIMFAGPMLARFKKAFIPKPGGDKIGRRRLIILDSYRKLIERQRAAGATTRTGESQSPAPQPLDAAAKTACGCGETELANSGDLERPIEEVSAGISRQQQKPVHAYPAPPLAGKGTPIESKRHQTRNKFGQKSSAPNPPHCRANCSAGRD